VQCRYNYLNVTGDTVSLQWKPDDMTFKVSGTYGISASITIALAHTRTHALVYMIPTE